MKKLIIVLGLISLYTGAFAASSVYPAEDRALLEELVSIPSVSSDIPQVNRAVACLRGFLERHGIRCETVKRPSDGVEILFASTVSGKTPDYLLNAHLDVVAASPEMFRLTEKEDGWFYGRGVGDCKGACVLVARLLIELKDKVSVGAVFSTDEEIGGSTAGYMVEQGYGAKMMVLIIDGAADKITVGQKGVTAFRVIAKGRGGHSSRPWEFDNPIDRLTDGLARFRAAWPKSTRADHWEDVCSVTQIKCNSEASNRIPDEAEAVVNLRFVDPQGAEKCEKLLRETTGCEIVRFPSCRPPFEFDPNDPRITRLQKTLQAHAKGRTVTVGRTHAAGDANHFAPLGVPVPIIGCGHEDSHGLNERFDPASSVEMVKTLSEYMTARP